MLRIHISSEADHFFLHTLEVSEEEFQSLKVEQGILVDFGNFPGKIISLLERCMAPAEGGDASRYDGRAVLVSFGLLSNVLMCIGGRDNAFTRLSVVAGRSQQRVLLYMVPCRLWQAVATGSCNSASLNTLPAFFLRRFQAVLSVKGGESVFRIVETNDFKQLPHITLSFRPGNDFAVKQFLAFRLAEVKANNADLTSELARTKVRG